MDYEFVIVMFLMTVMAIAINVCNLINKENCYRETHDAKTCYSRQLINW